MFKAFTLAVLLVSGPTLVVAQPPGWHEFVQGNFYQARQVAAQTGTAEGLAQACRAGLVLGGFLQADKESVESLHRAIQHCDAALAKKPDHYFARMSLAIALSFEGMRVKRPIYARIARKHIEQLTQQDPANPLGYGALAAWHSEVSAAGLFARLILKASRKHAKVKFEKALAMGAMDYPLKFEQVKYLARGNKEERQHAILAADELLQEPTYLALDKLLHERCKALLKALHGGKKKQIKATLKEVSAFRRMVGSKALPSFPLEVLQTLPPESTRS